MDGNAPDRWGGRHGREPGRLGDEGQQGLEGRRPQRQRRDGAEQRRRERQQRLDGIGKKTPAATIPRRPAAR